MGKQTQEPRAPYSKWFFLFFLKSQSCRSKFIIGCDQKSNKKKQDPIKTMPMMNGRRRGEGKTTTGQETEKLVKKTKPKSGIAYKRKS
jgi:hypothetical protein